MPKIITLSGRSGTGKSTLFNALLTEYPDLFREIPSYTTRLPRPGDETAYRYCSKEEFEQMEEEWKFAWTAKVLDKHFGTQITDLEGALEESKTSLMVLTPETIRRLRRIVNPACCKHLYLLAPPNECVLEGRLSRRGGVSQDAIRERLREDRTWDGDAEKSGLPFEFIPSTLSPEEVLARALWHIQGT